MKRFYIIFLLILSVAGCTRLDRVNPYDEELHAFTVQAIYPAGYEPGAQGMGKITVEDINQGSSYVLTPDSGGRAVFLVPDGLYRISVSDVGPECVFNGSVDRVRVTGDRILEVEMMASRTGTIIIKEIYCGGCMKYPEQGTYQSDQYVILHNNHQMVQYLDGICFGTLSPYNSNSNNPYGTLPEFVPIIQAVWQFPGDGDDFPLNPGEDAVLCLRGAVDHSAQYPLSVNLNKPDYFVCYNPTYFTNVTYHPVPGNNISGSRWLEVVIKTGQANAYTYSINSPATVIFKAPKGVSMREWVQTEGAVEQLPGSSIDRVVKIDPTWVMDAVEVFNGASTSNSKRLLPTLDAGYVTLSGTFLGHTLHRYVDEEQSAQKGYEVLMDSNNSSEDFYERETQSLHE